MSGMSWFLTPPRTLEVAFEATMMGSMTVGGICLSTPPMAPATPFCSCSLATTSINSVALLWSPWEQRTKSPEWKWMADLNRFERSYLFDHFTGPGHSLSQVFRLLQLPRSLLRPSFPVVVARGNDVVGSFSYELVERKLHLTLLTMTWVGQVAHQYGVEEFVGEFKGRNGSAGCKRIRAPLNAPHYATILPVLLHGHPKQVPHPLN